MNETIKAYSQILNAIYTLEEKTSHLRVEEVMAEQGIYAIPTEKDFSNAWDDWAAYIEQRMEAARKLERLKFKLSRAVNA